MAEYASYVRTNLTSFLSVRSIVCVLHTILNNRICSGEAHDFPELLYVNSGHHTLKIDGVPHIMEPGQLIFYAPHAFHEGDLPSSAVLSIISFEAELPELFPFYNRVITLTGKQQKVLSQIISEGLVINGIKDQAYIDEKVYEILELVGLVREHAGRYPHEFSGGQRQRIGIARAVIMNPEMLIADEPISALDVSIQAQVINLLNELRDKLGLTILFIAHDLSVVKYFSDRIGVMYYGHMVELADAEELFEHPMHPYTKSLLSAIPLPDPRSEKNRVRITYNPLAAHDYTQQQPTLREVLPGHFIRCNDAEELAYKKELGLA